MKAWVLRGINNLRLEETPSPQPRANEVLVKVKAAGICSSDISRVYTTGAYHYPIILGHEFSGETEDGRRVGVFPLLPCFKCESCMEERYETCSDYGYLGSRQDGAFAEYVVVPEWNLFALPDNMTFEQAALLEPAAVALHAVKRLDLSDTANAAVVGNGVIGRLIAKWLSVFGAAKVDLYGRVTAPAPMLYDVCVEAAGTAEALERCIGLTKPNGQLVLVGNPTVNFSLDQKLYWQILRRQLTVKGTWNSSYPADWLTVLENADSLRLGSYISHRYKLGELDKAFELIHSKREKHGKIIMLPE